MHPDMMREILKQREAERHEAGRRASLVREVRKSRRERGRAEAPDLLAKQPIPDYVDGTFRAATGEVPGGRVRAGRG